MSRVLLRSVDLRKPCGIKSSFFHQKMIPDEKCRTFANFCALYPFWKGFPDAYNDNTKLEVTISSLNRLCSKGQSIAELSGHSRALSAFFSACRHLDSFSADVHLPTRFPISSGGGGKIFRMK